MHPEREGERGSVPEVNKKRGMGDLGGVVHSDSCSSSSRRQDVGCDPKLGLLHSPYSLPKPWSLSKTHSPSKNLFGTLSLLTSPSFFLLLFLRHSWYPTPLPGPAVCADREQCVSGPPANRPAISAQTLKKRDGMCGWKTRWLSDIWE